MSHVQLLIGDTHTVDLPNFVIYMMIALILHGIWSIKR